MSLDSENRKDLLFEVLSWIFMLALVVYYAHPVVEAFFTWTDGAFVWFAAQVLR